MQCSSNAKDSLVGNCKNTEKGIGNVKKRVLCQPFIICYDSRNKRNDGNNNSQKINVNNNNSDKNNSHH